MKHKLLLATSVSILFFASSCKKDTMKSQSAENPPKKQGALLFWTNNPSILNSCGVITVSLSNGQQTNITGYYFVSPPNCVNLFGGYVLVNEGTYTYTVIAGGCNIPGGSVTVSGEQCNMARIQ